MGRFKSAEIGPRSQGVPFVVLIALGLALVVTAGFLGLTLTADRALEGLRPTVRTPDIGQVATGAATEILTRRVARPVAPATRLGPGPIFSRAVGEGIASAGVVLGLPAALVAATIGAQAPEVQVTGSGSLSTLDSDNDGRRTRSRVDRKKGRNDGGGGSDLIVSASGGPSLAGDDEAQGKNGNGNAHGNEHQSSHSQNCPGKRSTS